MLQSDVWGGMTVVIDGFLSRKLCSAFSNISFRMVKTTCKAHQDGRSAGMNKLKARMVPDRASAQTKLRKEA